MLLSFPALVRMSASVGCALDRKTTQLNQKQISVLAFISFFIGFQPFNCCLSVVLQLDKGDYPENSHDVFCPNKQHFESFVCLDLLSES